MGRCPKPRHLFSKGGSKLSMREWFGWVQLYEFGLDLCFISRIGKTKFVRATMAKNDEFVR